TSAATCDSSARSSNVSAERVPGSRRVVPQPGQADRRDHSAVPTIVDRTGHSPNLSKNCGVWTPLSYDSIRFGPACRFAVEGVPVSGTSYPLVEFQQVTIAVAEVAGAGKDWIEKLGWAPYHVREDHIEFHLDGAVIKL